MDLKSLCLVPLGVFSCSTLCIFVSSLAQRRRLDSRFGIITFQPGYLVSQFLNKLLLDLDNLQKGHHRRREFLIRNFRDLYDDAHKALKAYSNPCVAPFFAFSSNKAIWPGSHFGPKPRPTGQTKISRHGFITRGY